MDLEGKEFVTMETVGKTFSSRDSIQRQNRVTCIGRTERGAG